MNLHGIVANAIGAVNPLISVQIQVSTGSTTNADGSRTPAYAAPQTVSAQINALQYNDIVMADSLNIQGVRRKMYINGEVDGLVRSSNKGGDLVTFPNGTVWKVATVIEQWPDWCSVILTLQDGS